ncbi:aldo/keto reductase [Burkholderia sp. Bp8963]|nr:aldo/keto reductase [Burkholderia sp. Bp8963]
MRDIAAAHAVSVVRVALAWVLAKTHVTSVIVGAKNVAQLEDNLAAVDLTLSPEQIARLDEVSVLPAEYPGWMVAMQGAVRVPQPFKPKD